MDSRKFPFTAEALTERIGIIFSESLLTHYIAIGLMLWQKDRGRDNMKKVWVLVVSFFILLLSFSFFSAASNAAAVKSNLAFAKADAVTEDLSASSSSKPE